MARDGGAPLDAGEAVSARPWAMPEFDGPPTAATLERVEQQAWAEGEARGYAEGLKRGAADVSSRAATLGQLIDSLAAPLAVQDEGIERQLLELAWKIGEQLAVTQLRHDADAVARLVHEAIAGLAAPAQSMTVLVAPAQLDAVRGALDDQPPAQAWTLQADPTLKPGDCKVRGLNATADATLEARIRTLAEQYLDGGDDAHAQT